MCTQLWIPVGIKQIHSFTNGLVHSLWEHRQWTVCNSINCCHAAYDQWLHYL